MYSSPAPGLPMGRPSRVMVRLGFSSYTIMINGEAGLAQPPPPPLARQPQQDGDTLLGQPRLRFWASDDVHDAANASVRRVRYRPLACDGRDEALLQKVAVRLGSERIYDGLLMTELVVLAEGLDELEIRDPAAAKALGQEILSRRGELTPDEVKRVHLAFQQVGYPLGGIWDAAGVNRKRRSGQIITHQIFTPQPGHDDASNKPSKSELAQEAGDEGPDEVRHKKRKTREVERVSPPREIAGRETSSALLSQK